MQLPRAAWALALHCSWVQASTSHQLTPRQDHEKEDPSLDTFVRRADAGVAVLDDYLYIVGGHVARKIDGETKVQAVNATLSISLSEDWKPADVRANAFATDDGPRFVEAHGLWSDQVNGQVLLWGGADITGDDAMDRPLWRLQPNGNGGGEWREDISDWRIRRTSRGGYASCGGTGYLLGGRGNSKSDREAFGNEAIAVPGLITYDFKDNKWENNSATGLVDNGVWMRGELVCVEMPNRSPKLFVFGGAMSLEEGRQMNFMNVHYWDSGEKKWQKQETAGEQPPPRVATCAVGVPGPNGTYDIFLYSGWQGSFSEGKVLDDVWILSMPAFRWFKGLSGNAQGRHAHKCVRVGSQMIVVGGGARRDWWMSGDSLDRGLGIMDLNSGGAWRDEFKADSNEYQSPRAVREWYEKHGYDTTIWENDEVKSAFRQESSPSPSPSPGPSPSPSSGSNPGSDSDSSNTPAIVGGVVGGIGGLALVGLVAWFLLRRRRRQQQAQASNASPAAQHGYYEPVKRAEVDGTPSTYYTPTAEIGPGRTPQELDATRQQRPVELP